MDVNQYLIGDCIRVFPRRTKATPDDEFAFIGYPPLFRPRVNRVDISCTFSWDKEECEKLAAAWGIYYNNVRLGGIAFGDKGGDFISGQYLKKGYIITSRGCNNRCWFCDAWKREGKIRELPIVDGWNVLDNNLLQCSENHIRSVFAMLKRQRQRAEFTGGFETRLLKDWHIELLLDLKPKQIFFAYDKIDDLEPLIEVGRRLLKAGFTKESHTLRCYVLIGYPNDKIESADARLKEVLRIGMTPMAMLWRNKKNKTNLEWCRFQREWARPQIIHSKSLALKRIGQTGMGV